MVRVVVSIADEYADDVAGAAESLRRAGLRIDSVLEAAATVTGSIDASAVANLESLPEVAEVEQQRDYQLPPPDADVQ